VDFLYYPFGFLLLLGVVVTVHEFGHFIVARWSGVHVLRFSVGFGRALLSHRDRRGTEFTLAAIPLGGYVRMLDDRDPDQAELSSDELLQQMKVEGSAVVSYMDLTPWWRIAIALAGPAANFVLAFVIFWFISVAGSMQPLPMVDVPEPDSPLARAGLDAPAQIVAIDANDILGWQAAQLTLSRRLGDTGAIEFTFKDLRSAVIRTLEVPINEWHSGDVEPNFITSLGLKPTTFSVVGEVVEDSAAERAGLETGDFVVAVDGSPVHYWRDWVEVIESHPKDVIALSVRRGGRAISVQAQPDERVTSDGVKHGFLGVGPAYVEVAYGPFEAIAEGLSQTWEKTAMTLEFLKKMIFGQVSVRNLVGPVGIAQVAGQVVQSSWLQFVTVMALMSISVGIMNLLPIPLLDGGHILFNSIEVVTGKPVPERVQVVGVQIGLALVGGLFVLATYNDILRIF
jgi:regulator of sigma E protease